MPTPANDKSKNWIPNLTGRVDSVVEQAIQYLFRAVYSLRDGEAGPSPVASKGGVTNVNNLPGLLSQPQKGMAVPVSYKPTPQDILSRPGSIILYTPTNSVYVFDGSTNPGQFKLLGALGAPL